MVESTGGKPHRLDTGPGSSFVPSFSRNGKWIYFSNTRTGRAEGFRVPIDGGPATQLTYAGCSLQLESVDGRTIYCQKFSMVNPTPSVTNELDEVPVAGGPQRPLPISVVFYSFDVVPDGIYFITRREWPWGRNFVSTTLIRAARDHYSRSVRCVPTV
jgi:eukaryotic-like serine/threonine-protein kinase